MDDQVHVSDEIDFFYNEDAEDQILINETKGMQTQKHKQSTCKRRSPPGPR